MKSQVVESLKKIRKNLATESAWGPEGNKDVSDVGQGEPGDLGAENYSEAGDNVDTYLVDCVDALISMYDVEEEEAWDFVFTVAAMAAEEGLLPELPEDEASDEDLTDWLGKAGTTGFKAMVLQSAAEMASLFDHCRQTRTSPERIWKSP